MAWVAWGILVLMVFITAGLFISIVVRQKKLDKPCTGVLIIDRQDPEVPCMVYLQANVDPGTLKDGERVKFKVKVVREESQGKQA